MATSKESPVPDRTGPRHNMAILANRLTGLSHTRDVLKYEQVGPLWTVSIDHNYACRHSQKGTEKINRLTNLRGTGRSKTDAGNDFLNLPEVQKVWKELAAKQPGRNLRRDNWEAEKAQRPKGSSSGKRFIPFSEHGKSILQWRRSG